MFDTKKFESNKIGGVLTLKYKDNNVYKDGTDIPFETLEKVAKYNSEYVSKAAEKASDLGKKYLQDDESLNKVVVKYPYSPDSSGAVEVTVDRSRTFPAINGNDPVTKSKITVAVTEPFKKVVKSKIQELEADLTKTLLS